MPQKKKVLYIEDQLSNRMLVGKLLEVAGFESLGAESGMDGLDMIASIEPDLILIDMNMPGLDGYEVATRIKASDDFRHIPIIALTGNIKSGDREKSLIAGCDGYIPKPIDIATFVDEVEKYLGGYREHVDAERENALLREYAYKLVQKLERKIRELSEALIQAQEASRIKTEFLKTVTHELRTPLNAIIGFTELLNEETGVEDTSTFVDAIASNSNSLLSLVNKIIKFNLLSSGEVRPNFQPVAMSQILEVILARLSAAVNESGARIETDIAEDLPVIEADPQEVQTVLEELVGNAIKYSGDGVVHIDCRFKPDAIEWLGADSQGGAVQVCVRDHGKGIPAEKRKRLFELLHIGNEGSADGYEGVGIGLPLCKKLVDLHHGELWVRSEEGKGSTFFVALPVKQDSGV